MNSNGRRPVARPAGWHTPYVRTPSGAALLLSRVGAHVAARFAARVGELGLTPAQVSALRAVAQSPGLQQQALAERLGTVPSRVVKLVDELEAEGLVERRTNPANRRQHELHLREDARQRLGAVRRSVTDHDAEITAPLSPDELSTLITLLTKLARAHGIQTDTPPAGPGTASGTPSGRAP